MFQPLTSVELSCKQDERGIERHRVLSLPTDTAPLSLSLALSVENMPPNRAARNWTELLENSYSTITAISEGNSTALGHHRRSGRGGGGIRHPAVKVSADTSLDVKYMLLKRF